MHLTQKCIKEMNSLKKCKEQRAAEMNTLNTTRSKPKGEEGKRYERSHGKHSVKENASVKESIIITNKKYIGNIIVKTPKIQNPTVTTKQTIIPVRRDLFRRVVLKFFFR